MELWLAINIALTVLFFCFAAITKLMEGHPPYIEWLKQQYVLSSIGIYAIVVIASWLIYLIAWCTTNLAAAFNG